MNHATCFPSFRAASSLGTRAGLYLRVGDPGAASTSFARSTTLEMARTRRVLVVVAPGGSVIEAADDLRRLNDGDDLPTTVTLLAGGDVRTTRETMAELEALPHLDGLPHRVPALVVEAGELEDPAGFEYLLDTRTRAGKTSVVHSHVANRRFHGGGSAVAWNRLSNRLRILCDEAVGIGTSPHGLVELTFFKNRPGPADQIPMRFDGSRWSEVEPDATLDVAQLERFAAGRALLSDALEGVDPTARDVLLPGWLSSLEALTAALEEFAPEPAA